MSLTTTHLCSLLTEIAEIRVTQDAAGVLVHVPAIGRSMLIDADAARQHTFVAGPNGERSLLLLLDVAGVPVQAVVAPTDLVFAPDTRDSGLGISVDVTDTPPLVSFSEMMRDLKTLERRSSTEGRVDEVVATLVMCGTSSPEPNDTGSSAMTPKSGCISCGIARVCHQQL
jgi:hypothetical protein